MADPQQYNVALAREKLRALDAFFFENMENTEQLLIGDAEVNIAWKVSTPEAIPNLRYYLDNYTWATNPTKQRWIVDPQIKEVPLLGTWRQVNVRDIKRTEKGTEFYYVILTLRKGYIRTLVTETVVDYSEARLEQCRQMPAGNDGATPVSEFIILKWNNVSPDKVDAVKGELEALEADTFAPVIRGETLGTAFHRLYVASNIETDGSATISMLLAKPEFTLTGCQTWATAKQSTVTYHWDVPRRIAQALIETLKGTGKSVVPSYNPAQGLVDIVEYARDYTAFGSITGTVLADLCDYTMYGDLYWGVSNPNSYTCPVYVPGVMYYKDFSDNGDGSYDVSIRSRKARYRNYDLRQSMESALTERYERIQMSVTSEAVPDISTVPAGSLYRQQRTPNDDCSSTYDTSYDRGMPKTVTLKLIQSSAFEDVYESVDRNKATVADTTNHVDGYIYVMNPQMNDFGIYDTTNRIRKAKESTLGRNASISSGFEIDYERTLRNTATVLTAPASVQGFIYRVDNEKNDFGIYDARETVRAAVYGEMTRSMSTSSKFEIDYARIVRNSASVIIAPAQTNGYIYRIRNNFNDFKMYDADEDVRQGVYAEIGSHQVSSSAFSDDYDRTVRNSTSIITALAQVAGSIYTVDSSTNDFGLYDGQERAKLAKEVDTGRIRTLSSGVSEVYQRVVRNKADILDTTSGVETYIYKTSNDVNDFRLYDAGEQVIKSKPVELYHTFSTNYGTGWIRVFRNLPIATLEARLDALPINPHISIQIQDDLTYDGTLMYSPGSNNSATTFSGADAYWVSNDLVYDSTRRKVYKYSYPNYRKFYAIRQSAANAMNNAFKCGENDKPRYEHGLWEAVYATEPEVTSAPTATALFG